MIPIGKRLPTGMAPEYRMLVARLLSYTDLYLKEVSDANFRNGMLIYDLVRSYSAQEFFTMNELRLMGHPYRRLGIELDDKKRAGYLKGDVGLPPYIVNRHSRTTVETAGFYDSWTVTRREEKSAKGQISILIVNTAPYGKYFNAKGTKKMIGRPILEQALEKTKDERRYNLNMARLKALKATKV